MTVRNRSSGAVLAAFISLALVACFRGQSPAALPPPSPPPTLPAGALPQLDSRARTLDGRAFAQDASRPDAVAGLLDRQGYVTGSEREFFGRAPTFNHVVARVLEFRAPAGASAFLEWLGQNASAFIGDAESLSLLSFGSRPLLFPVSGCDCHPQVPSYLAVWQRGIRVHWLFAAGPEATRGTVRALAATFDRVG